VAISGEHIRRRPPISGFGYLLDIDGTVVDLADTL
jgi:hypothetical protein